MKNENFKKYGSSHVDIFAEIFAEISEGNGKSIHAERTCMWNCGRILQCSLHH